MERFPSGQRGQTVNLLAQPSKVRILLSPLVTVFLKREDRICFKGLLPGFAMGNCFYEKGLAFECQGCGYCCSSEPGYVFLSEKDIQGMADCLGMERRQFIDTFCRIVDMGAFKMISLREKENYDCIFLTDKGCKVYSARPRQCADYPFWAHILEDQESWDAESKLCPGMNRGKIHTKREIDAILKDRRANNPVVIM